MASASRTTLRIFALPCAESMAPTTSLMEAIDKPPSGALLMATEAAASAAGAFDTTPAGAEGAPPDFMARPGPFAFTIVPGAPWEPADFARAPLPDFTMVPGAGCFMTAPVAGTFATTPAAGAFAGAAELAFASAPGAADLAMFVGPPAALATEPGDFVTAGDFGGAEPPALATLPGDAPAGRAAGAPPAGDLTMTFFVGGVSAPAASSAERLRLTPCAATPVAAG
mmetsp:Transcript_16173/g.43582  ORF Transcript_16173/g.43582 Transcript_16173/m.43582 type:complete len:226 (+) Transcript_16173:1155-1832(+)